jgi:hypothetical protein
MPGDRRAIGGEGVSAGEVQRSEDLQSASCGEGASDEGHDEKGDVRGGEV